MRNIAIISARSGSKGLKDKNIKILDGKPLLAYSIDAARKSKLFDTIMVSTDSKKYAEISKAYGAEVPFLRSEATSGDRAGSWEVVLEVLKRYKEFGQQYESVTLLQPTSPLRLEKDIVEGYRLLKEKEGDSITAVCEMDHSPLWSNTLPNTLSMKNFEREEYSECGRQQLPQYYRINGALYIRKIEYSSTTITLKKNREYAYIMPRERSIDIDTEMDFKIAEVLLRQRGDNT
ncbi:acylneuraminate cytidylyltransferase family protein [Blautia sp. AM16-16B]|nr:acylneuraminate cytidylyltransferase family protein [Blautia sp. AM16-16B]